MDEFEIKLQADPGYRAALEAELGRNAITHRIHLQASYFDTADRDLARAGMALRLRKEGRRWIQTLKAAGSGVLLRFEHNVPLISSAPRTIEAERHSGTQFGDRLLELVAEKGPLKEVYRTDVWRRSRKLRSRNGTVELALDTGHIEGAGRRGAICELEIELLAGRPLTVLEVGRRWTSKYPLWLDIRSKAERGDRLAHGVVDVPASKAQALKLPDHPGVEHAWRAVLASTLDHILTNACELADEPGQSENRAEQVHQVRVGLRRVRSALRLFKGWPGVPETTAVAEASAQLFRRLGRTRDRDVLLATVGPALQSAGTPCLEWPDFEEQEPPAHVLREGNTQILWLDLLTWIHDEGRASSSPAGPTSSLKVPLSAPRDSKFAVPAAAGHDATDEAQPTNASASLRDLVAKRLQRWHKGVVARRQEFARMEDVERHTLRKRIKRLRYAVDFVESLFPKRAVKRYRVVLSEAQKVFGEYSDLRMATDALAGGEGPGVWFARGWLTARRDATLLKCESALEELARARKFWK